jgi:hypothetical protein
MLNYAFYYCLVICLGAYGLMIVLGWRMHRFVRRHLRGASNQQRKALELQRQLTRTLVVQAPMHFLVEKNQFSIYNLKVGGPLKNT